MTDPTPQTVDRVARAIREAIRNAPATLPDVDTWHHLLATAALNAMPQPVGYGVKTGNAGWYGPHQSLPHAQKVAADLYGGDVTVVALVPVEDQ